MGEDSRYYLIPLISFTALFMESPDYGGHGQGGRRAAAGLKAEPVEPGYLSEEQVERVDYLQSTLDGLLILKRVDAHALWRTGKFLVDFGLYFMVHVPCPTSTLKSAPSVAWERRR